LLNSTSNPAILINRKVLLLPVKDFILSCKSLIQWNDSTVLAFLSSLAVKPLTRFLAYAILKLINVKVATLVRCIFIIYKI